MELCIAEAPANPTPALLKGMFQKLFTKGPNSTGSPYLNYMDACIYALEAQESAKTMTQFLFRQFCVETNKSGRSSGRLQEAFDRLQNEYTQLQQSTSTQRIEAEQALAASESRYQTMHQKLTDAYNKEKELLQQVEFFRQHSASNGAGSVSSRSQGSGQTRSNGSGNGNRQAFPNRGAVQPPPFQQVLPSNNNIMRQRGGVRPHPDPTPIRIAPSFESSRTASGAPAIRNVTNQGYVFSTTSGRNLSMASSGSSAGGPVRRMQQSFSSRPSIYGRSSGGGTGGFLAAGRRR